TRRLDGDWYVQPPPSGPSPLTGALAGVAWDSLPPATSLVELAGGSESHATPRSEEHTSELQSRGHLVCRLLLEKKATVVGGNALQLDRGWLPGRLGATTVAVQYNIRRQTACYSLGHSCIVLSGCGVRPAVALCP